MTFKDIIARWHKLPRHRDTGKPLHDNIQIRSLLQDVLAADRRGWFKACHNWYSRGAPPDELTGLDELLTYLPPAQRKMAIAHLDCARSACCRCEQAFTRGVESLANQQQSLEPFLLELAHEIRSGGERQSIGSPVYITLPLVREDKKTGELARFVLDTLPGGQGCVFPAPAQAFLIQLGDDFQSTFSIALAAARACFTNGDAASLQLPGEDFRVQFELLKPALRQVPISLKGLSGGAALALGVAKCLADAHAEVDGAGLGARGTLLRSLPLDTIAVTAEVTAAGHLYPVGDLFKKVLAIVLTREAQMHEINVLVIAADQPLSNGISPDREQKSFLLPSEKFVPKLTEAGAELRTPGSLLVIRAADLAAVVETLHDLQVNTLLSVLEKPAVISAYLLGGSRSFPLFLTVLMFVGWYFFPSFWFVPMGALAFAVGLLCVCQQIKQLKRQAALCLLPQGVAYSPGMWADMMATLEARRPARCFTKIRGWFKTLLRVQTERRLTLSVLPRLWRRNGWFWLRFLLVVFLPLCLLLLPSQYFLAEYLFPGQANLLGGESRRGEGKNIRYAGFASPCATDDCAYQTTIGSYGLMRLSVAPKPRVARSLRVTCVDALSYVKVDDNGPRGRQITVPVIDDEVQFYYGIEDNTPWEIELEVEVRDYGSQVLSRARITGNRAPPGQ